jgi:adenylate cyclase
MRLTALQTYQLEKIGKMTLGFFLFMGVQAIILEGVNIIVLINTFIDSLIIGTTVALLELHLFSGKLRKWNFPAIVAMKTLLYLTVVLTTLLLLTNVLPFMYLKSETLRNHPFVVKMGIHPSLLGLHLLKQNAPVFAKLILINLAGCFILVFFNQMSRMLGKDTLLRLLKGKYHLPIEEERIFMFLDIKSSTRIAEQLGNLRYSNLLRDFFYDLGKPVLESKGEIYQYVGDEVVISWKLKEGMEHADCILCFFKIEEMVKQKEKYYKEQYGLVPGFKAGLHGGKVVTTQVGDIKSEIVYHGDVLNTAARIQELCNVYGSKLLVSDTLAGKLNLPNYLSLHGLEQVQLKGKEALTWLMTVTRQLSTQVKANSAIKCL